MVNLKKIPEGFKQTEVGIIPSDWSIVNLSEVVEKFINGGTPSTQIAEYWNGNIPWITGADILNQKVAVIRRYISNEAVKKSSTNVIKKGNILFVSRTGVGKLAIAPFDIAISQDFTGIYTDDTLIDTGFLFRYFDFTQETLKTQNQGTSIQGITRETLSAIKIPLPPTKAEQTAIATALNDVDSLITQLEKLIAKKRAVKQGAMQELLKPKRSWEGINLEKMTDCLDNLRLPLNETQRLAMQGDYPYCGANGILDYLNDYKINDDVILIAEDGGYFDEYATRPIAYKMKGKFWVNNHAHILKAKAQFDQNFIYYSLVHKNILDLLASGTRAKLNKSQMYKIKIHLPKEKEEQTRIAQILSDMDAEIEALEKKLDKYRMIKQGMMQVLLTGKVRLI